MAWQKVRSACPTATAVKPRAQQRQTTSCRLMAKDCALFFEFQCPERRMCTTIFHVFTAFATTTVAHACLAQHESRKVWFNMMRLTV
eukprot:3750832-Pleurochrysis_carterae.AAC.2